MGVAEAVRFVFGFGAISCRGAFGVAEAVTFLLCMDALGVAKAVKCIFWLERRGGLAENGVRVAEVTNALFPKIENSNQTRNTGTFLAIGKSSLNPKPPLCCS